MKSKFKEKLARKLKRLNERLNIYNLDVLDSPQTTYNYYGGWSIGFIQGQIALLEDLLDDLEYEYTSDTEVAEKQTIPHNIEKEGNVETEQTEQAKQAKQAIPQEREQKEIPPEMLDMEF